MTSERVFVWTWLPGSESPVVAGVVEAQGDVYPFAYAQSYLARPDAISLYEPELPLGSGPIPPAENLALAGALRDASPDGWGRTVIDDRFEAAREPVTELDYMLHSGSSRLGALDYQARPDEYVPRDTSATLDELHEAADRLESGIPLSAELDQALIRGTSIGGARPKATIVDGEIEYVAKFSSSSDRTFHVVNAEATALMLARRARVRVPDSRVVSSLGKDVLLVRRFDREGRRRIHVVSALTMSRHSELTARYVSYPDVLDVLRERGMRGDEPGLDLFRRIAFNIAISNSDDHARNHAAFWDGQHLTLTPAYDLAPGNRSGETATQAMAWSRDGDKTSNFASLVGASQTYGLDRREAQAVIDEVIAAITDGFDDAADEARVPSKDRRLLREHLFLNPGALHGYTNRFVAPGWE